MNTSVPLNFKDKCPTILRPRPSMLKFLFTHYAFEHWSKVIKYFIEETALLEIIYTLACTLLIVFVMYHELNVLLE